MAENTANWTQTLVIYPMEHDPELVCINIQKRYPPFADLFCAKASNAFPNLRPNWFSDV